MEDKWVLIIPVALSIPLLIFFFTWIIPHWINDNKWEKYMIAWDLWERKGKKGKMPVPEDYGYKNIT